MAFRKRKSPAPAFRQPSPFNPIGGKYAPMGREGILSRCAMMQIVGDDQTTTNQDTHANYVVCRGFDPETEKFFTSIPVAKPYGARGTFPYKLAEMYPAIKPRTRLGDGAGVAHTTTGHPADLDETIDILEDDAGTPIWWLLLDWSLGHFFRWAKLDDDLDFADTATVSLWQGTDGDWAGWDQDSTEDWEDCYAPPLMTSGTIAGGKWVWVADFGSRKVVVGHEC